ncbi:hypothetical protein [Komagataeibacter medellinensis]|nr:hypothetical protein [Komagataeibacter medellinensis]
MQRRPYHLGGRILNLSRIAGDDDGLRARMHLTLEAIAHESGATAYPGVSSEEEAVYLDIVGPRDPVVCASRLQRRETLEGSAVELAFSGFHARPGQACLCNPRPCAQRHSA